VPAEPKRVKALIGKTVIVAVLATAFIVAAGGIMYLVRHGAAGVHYGVFAGEPTDLRTLRGVLADALRLSGRGVIQLGLIVLVGAQVVRVALTMWLFVAQKNRAFVAISAVVLAVLLYSLLSGG
jgi:uncharacterized membrane protein